VNALNNPPNNDENAVLSYFCDLDCVSIFVITVHRYLNELKPRTPFALPGQTDTQADRLTAYAQQRMLYTGRM